MGEREYLQQSFDYRIREKPIEKAVSGIDDLNKRFDAMKIKQMEMISKLDYLIELQKQQMKNSNTETENQSWSEWIFAGRPRA